MDGGNGISVGFTHLERYTVIESRTVVTVVQCMIIMDAETVRIWNEIYFSSESYHTSHPSRVSLAPLQSLMDKYAG